MDIIINDDRNVYVMSDIHNHAEKFKKLLKKIKFNENDLLIIAGDIFDRGNEPVELYFEILKYSNIQVVQGNHDVWVAKEILKKYGHKGVGEYVSYNTVSIMEKRLPAVDMLRLAEWIQEKPYYINLDINGKKYQIAHAQTFLTPDRIWNKRKIYMGDEHYEYFLKGMEEHEQFISVVGHTVTDNGRIWISPSGQTIRIDCGAGYKNYDKNGTLGAIRLNDMKEFYVE